MTNIFLYEDIILEISKHLIHTNFINFSLVNKLCYKTINKLIDNIDEYKFLQDNKLVIINKNFICNLDIIIDLNNLTNFINFYPKYKKYKLYCVKYQNNGILIKIYLNSYLTIHDCLSYDDAYTKLNNLLLLLQNLNVINNIPKIKLIRTLSNVCFLYSNKIHHDIKSIYKNREKVTFTRSRIVIYFNGWNYSKINIKYKNFNEFYKFFMSCIKL